MLHGGFYLADEALMRDVLVKELHCLLELIHENCIHLMLFIWHLETREKHDDLPI